jgi:trk system potassium uptake protein TrkH
MQGGLVADVASRPVTPALAGVAYIFGFLVIALSGAMLVPTFLAAYEGERSVAAAFALTALGGAFVGGSLVFAMQGSERQMRVFDAIALVTFAWLVLPLLAAIPPASAGAASGLIDAYFEAMSALTTTGATVLADLDHAPKAVLIWRALLAWLGGYATVVMAATVLSGFGTAGEAVHRPLLPISAEAAKLVRVGHALRDFLAIYATVTVFAFVLLRIDGASTLTALCQALSTIATAGLSFGAQADIGRAGPFSSGVLAFLMVFGATSFVTHWAAWRGRPRAYWSDVELRLLGLMFVAASCVFLLAYLTAAARAPFGREWGALLFDAVSMVTTTGLWHGTTPLASGLILGAIAFPLIGGASLSTAGGVKLIRFALLVQQGRGEIRRLTHPRGVIRLRYKGLPLSAELLIGAWALFAAYFALLAFGTLALCAFGLGLMPALTAATAALSNTGPLYLLLPEGAATGYGALPSAAKILLAVIMAAGRLEVLALLSLLSAAFWRR